MKRALLAFLILFGLTAHASTRTLVTLTDASGDDHGDGRLVYPQQGEYEPGDLDLKTLQISRDEQGIWFEASFQNTIRNPTSAAGPVGAESLAEFARKGFYQFNLDIYIDTDRVKGSGNTFTLPGRQARISADYAWERAVILTPRPEAMRAQLLDVLAQQYPNRPQREVQAGIDQTIYFPTTVRVRGRTVAFLVPSQFFGASDGSDWAITSFVTAAQRSTELKLSMIPSGKTPFEELTLGVLQPQPGRPRDAIGYGSGPRPTPIFDLLTRSARQQSALLANGSELTGLSWGAHAADDTAASAEASRGAAPATMVEATPEARSGGGSFLSNPWESLRDLFRSAPVAPAAPVVAVPIQVLLDPPRPGSANPATASPQPAAAPALISKTPVVAPSVLSTPPATVQPPPLPMAAPVVASSIAKRLQTLQQLFDDKLISEAEYKQQRQRILNEL